MVLHILRRASHGAGGAGPAGIVLAAWMLFAPCGPAGSSEPASSARAGTGRTSSPTGQEPAERQAPEQPAGRQAAEPASAQSAQRPNIVLVIGDDHSWHDIGCYGNPQVRTPNIDRLAERGMRFTAAFTATAMCSPTRQQLYTGLFPVRNGAYPNHSQVYPGTKSMVHYFRQLGYRVGLHGKWHIGPPESFPFERVNDVAEFVNREPLEPYLLVYASNNPHLPWPEPQGYDPPELKVPPYLVDTPETRQALARYYTEVTMLDEELGQCLKVVEQSGAAERTIFIYTSEQGAQFPFGKWTCYDTGLHVALIVAWPGRVKPGSVSDALVQYVDLVPTLIEAAGGTVPEGLDGRSFLNVLLGCEKHHRQYVFGVQTTLGIIAGKPYPIRSIRSQRYKYIMNLLPEATFVNVVTESDSGGCWESWRARATAGDEFAAARVRLYQHRPAEEFYDLEADPYELHNLAEEAKYREQMDKMRAELLAWMLKQGDRGVATELEAPRHQGRAAADNQPANAEDRQRRAG